MKLPKCAYKIGDLLRQDKAMGIVTKHGGDFYTFQLIGHGGITHTTSNVTIRHYLKLVKAQEQIKAGRGDVSEFVARNITLEEELLSELQADLISGKLDRLSEATLNKLNKGEV